MKVRGSLLALIAVLLTVLASALPVMAAPPTDFTATTSMIQQGRTNIPLGESGRLLTINEVFTGAVTSTTWGLLAGATVEINNTSNTTVDWVTGEIQGTTQGSMKIAREDGSTLEMATNGKLMGNLFFGGVMEGQWAVTGKTGVFAGYNAQGTIAAAMWAVSDPNPPYYHLEGIATLSGSYN